MKTGAEQARLRRDYVCRKRQLSGKLALSALGMLLTLGAIIWTAHHAWTTPDFLRSAANGGVFFNALMVAILLYALAVLGALMGLSSHYALRQMQEVTQLPYAAPVTVQTLPLEEVLVRGAQQTEGGATLLRVVPGPEVLSEQLLHSVVFGSVLDFGSTAE